MGAKKRLGAYGNGEGVLRVTSALCTFSTISRFEPLQAIY